LPPQAIILQTLSTDVDFDLLPEQLALRRFRPSEHAYSLVDKFGVGK
jgi:hypothetical protein